MHISIVSIESRGDIQSNFPTRKQFLEDCEQILKEVLSA